MAVRVVGTLLPDCQLMLPFFPLLSKPFCEPGAVFLLADATSGRIHVTCLREDRA